MRRFTDREQRVWDVVLGRASWGAHFAIFVPLRTGPAIRQAALRASGYDAALDELDRLTDDRLQELLDGSEPKEEEAS